MSEAYTMTLTPMFRFTESLDLDKAYKATLPDGSEVMFRYHGDGSYGATWLGRPGWEMTPWNNFETWWDSIREARDSAMADVKVKQANLMNRITDAYIQHEGIK